MKNTAALLLFTSLIGVFFLPLLIGNGAEEDPVISGSKDQLIRYEFELINKSPELVDNVFFDALAPLKETPFQRLESIDSNMDFEIVDVENGSQYLRFNMSEIPPFGRHSITVTAKLTLWDSPQRDRVFEYEESGTSSLDFSEPGLHKVLGDVDAMASGPSEIEWVRASLNWISENMKDIGFLAEDRGAIYALKHREGDCTEFTHALVSLSRAKEISSIFVSGFSVSSKTSLLRPSDYHNWAYLNIDGVWHTGDPLYGRLLDGHGNLIAFNIVKGTDDDLGRFSISDPRLKVLMH